MSAQNSTLSVISNVFHMHVSHMILDNLSDVVILGSLLQLPKVIDQWSHAGRKVENTVHQLTERDLACI